MSGEGAPATTICQHRWMIEGAVEGGAQTGRCKLCGTTKQFPTALKYRNFDKRLFSRDPSDPAARAALFSEGVRRRAGWL